MNGRSATCSLSAHPVTPSGAVIPEKELHFLIEKAVEHNVVLVSDECYSELYYDEAAPPDGSAASGNDYGEYRL